MATGSGRAAAVSPPWVPKLVGRDAELALLAAELERARSGALRCAALLGDPGIGKTRLARELTVRGGVVDLSARAYRSGATTPFGLWSEALEGHLRGLRPQRILDLCSGFLDDLAVLLRSVAAVRGGEPDREQPRARLLAGLAVLLGNLARAEPVVVLLDDAHLADASSWEALSYLARTLAGARVLVVVTARPAELAADPVGTEVLLGLEQDGLARRLRLDPLPHAAVRDLAAALVPGEPPPALVDWLAARSQGNPLFAIGLLRALLEEGADLAAPSLRALPEELTARVAHRMRALDAGAVELLELLAVLGRRVDLRSLVGLTGRAADPVATTLEFLVRSRLVAEDDRGAELVYEIAHPLVQDAVYEQIGGARRRLLHRRVGRGLLDAGRLGEAAPHYARSALQGEDETVKVLCAAVREAEQREAYREALEILGALVDVLPAGDPRWRDVVGALSWEAQWVVDHRADTHAELGIPALRRMDAVLEPLPDPAARAVVKFRLANFLAWGSGRLDEAEQVAQAALALFEQAGDRRGRLLAEHELAWIQGLRGDSDATLQNVARVIQAATASGDSVVLRRAARTMMVVSGPLGRFDEAHAWADRSMALAREAGDGYALLAGTVIHAMAFTLEGRIREAWALLQDAEALDAGWRDYALHEFRCVLHWAAGAFPDATAEAQRALALIPGAVSKRRAFGLSYGALAAVEMGDLARAARIMDRIRPAYAGRHWLYYSTWAAHVDALVRAPAAGAAETLAATCRAADRMLADGVLPMAAFMLLDIAELAAAVGDRAAARQAATDLAAVAAQVDRDLQRALAASAAAWAELLAGDSGRAAAQAQQAVDLLRDLGYQAVLGRAQDVLGRAVAVTDRQQAVETLTAAAATLEACGATWRRQRVLERLRALGSRGRTAVAALSGPSSLTVREREVARLAVAGLTSREIGERLFIAERTVEGHLARIYAKLGVGSKVQLVARAGDLGLGGDA